MNRYIMTDGVKSIDLPQFPNEAWHFYEGEPEEKEDFYAKVSAVYRAVNLTASATANIPFALVKKSGKDFDISSEWENKVGFMPKPNELIRLWRMSLCMTNKAYGFMENSKAAGKNIRYIVPTTITPIVDKSGLQGFKRTIGNATETYPLDSKCPIFWMWRMDHTTELLPAKATEFQAMMSAAGILYYSDSFIQAFFKRGGIKPTMLVLKGMAPPGAIEKIENVWDKIIRGGYKYLGKIFQGVDANGGLEAQTIGEGVDNLKDETLTNAKIADIAMSVGMPLSLLLSNSANYATAATEYKSWYENALAPWCSFMAEEMTDKLFKPLGLRFEFRPEMTDPGQEDEVARAGAYSTYVNAGMKPSVAAQVVGIELPEGIEFEALDTMQEEKQQQAIDLMQEKQSSSDKEEKPDAVQKEKEKVKGWVTINGNHVLIDEEGELSKDLSSVPPKVLSWVGGTDGFNYNGSHYTVYHGTTKERAESIHKEGLKPTEGTGVGWFMVTTSYQEAMTFAGGYGGNSVIEFRIPTDKIIEYLGKGTRVSAGDIEHGLRKVLDNNFIYRVHGKKEAFDVTKGWVTINGNHVLLDDNAGNTATTKQAIEIIHMQSLGFTPKEILNYLEENNIDYVYAYHITDKSHVESITENGIRMSSQDGRPDASYFFLDKNDANAVNADQLGYRNHEVITIRIPRADAASIRDDGLFNGTFTSSYSAARLLREIPRSWIVRGNVSKFIPNLDQLKEMEIWRKFAFRKNKKGEPLDFPFEVKTLPDDIADGIRERLTQAIDEDGIKAAFDVKYSPDQPRDDIGRWTDEGNSVSQYGELIKKTDSGDEIYQLRNANNLPNKSIIAVQMTGKNIYISTDTDMTHGKMIREINGIEDSVDNYVRFEYGYGNRNELIASIASAGIVVDSSWLDVGRTKAIDNIYKAIDKLVAIGLPSSTIVRIMDYGNPDILFTAKTIKTDYALLELADAINKAAELSVLPEIRATEQPMIVADLVEPTDECN